MTIPGLSQLANSASSPHDSASLSSTAFTASITSPQGSFDLSLSSQSLSRLSSKSSGPLPSPSCSVSPSPSLTLKSPSRSSTLSSKSSSESPPPCRWSSLSSPSCSASPSPSLFSDISTPSPEPQILNDTLSDAWCFHYSVEHCVLSCSFVHPIILHTQQLKNYLNCYAFYVHQMLKSQQVYKFKKFFQQFSKLWS